LGLVSREQAWGKKHKYEHVRPLAWGNKQQVWGHLAHVSLFSFLKIPLCLFGVFVISYTCHNFIYSLFFCWLFFSYVLFALGLWQEKQAKVCGDINLGISQAMACGNN
jgi:hypothetical membrane protein